MSCQFYRHILKPILFLFEAEAVHNFFTLIGSILGRMPALKVTTSKLFRYDNQNLEQNLFGIQFKNPVGLAAGFDYNGKLASITDSVGFGFESVGTVTNSPYDGNKYPRLARLPKSQSLLVNKGFKSNGIEAILKDIHSNRNITQTLGISIGATNSRECSTSQAQITDIIRSFEYLKLHPAIKKISYIELNISCPNVLGSGSLADKDSLTKLLNKINSLNLNKPLFVKFPLEIEWDEAKELIQIMINKKVSAVIIANLLKSRDGKYFKDNEIKNFEGKKGNFSGKPTFELSNELISKVYKRFGDKIKIIGVGGVFNAQDAYEKLRRGANLVQLITGMIFEGPQVIGEINKGITEKLQADGYQKMSQIVGTKKC